MLRTPRAERPGGARPRKARQEQTRTTGRVVLYGRNAVRESLRAGRRRHYRLSVARGVERDSRLAEIESLAARRNVPVSAVDRDQIEQVAGPGHQGVMLESSPYPYQDSTNLARLQEQRSIVLVLDGIEDPRNVGTLLRTAEAVGVALVVLPQDRAAGITPAVVNASSGAVEHLRIARETNIARWLGTAKEAGFWVLGLAGDEAAASLYETDTAAPVALVVGSEGKGIRRLVKERCDALVSLPMTGKIESLNAAVAGSIALYEIYQDTSEASREAL